MSENVLMIGATSDIAQEAAKIYAERKAKLFLVGRDARRLDIVAQDLRARGASDVGFCVADLDHIAICERVAADATAFLEKVDVVVMAQGVLGDPVKLAADVIAMESMFRVNVLSFIALANALKEALKKQPGSTLAIISSVAGDRGRQNNIAYGASKAALTAVASGTRQQLHPYGVNVLTVKPGFVATKMTAHLKQGLLFASPRKVAQDMVRAIDKKKQTIYTPFFWWGIMSIIKLLPEKMFRKLKF